MKRNINDTMEAMRLEEIIVEMKELLDEACNLLPSGIIRKRAEAYWLGHIAAALDDEHYYAGSGTVTMANTLDEMRGEDD